MNRRRRPNVSSPLGLSTFTRLRLRAALFLAGAVVMALGILGSRIIGPHFGAGLFVGTSLISVAMLALASGYWLGGQIVDRRPSLLLFAGVLFTAAAVVAVIPLWSAPVMEAGWKFGLRGGSLFAAACILFPPLLLLGMASPIAVRLEAGEVERAGRSAGGIHAIPMAGAAAGAVLAGFLLLPTFRVPTVLAILAGTLAFAAILASGPGHKKPRFAAALLIMLAGIALAWPGSGPSGLLAATSSGGADLRVVQHEGSRYLFVDHTIQTTVNARGRSEEKYVYFLASRLLLARPHTRSAVLVGLGGSGIVPLLREHDIAVDCVDSSALALLLARAHLGLSLPASRTHAIDGRVFLKMHPARFDSVILDVFTGERPSYLLASMEGLATAKAALTPSGLLVLNTWGLDEERGVPTPSSEVVHSTLQQVFRHVLAVPTAENLLFFASDEPIQPQQSSVMLTAFDLPRHFTWLPVPSRRWPTTPVITDDLNRFEALDAPALEELRLALRTIYPANVRDALVWE
jgi:spermidine synthase